MTQDEQKPRPQEETQSSKANLGGPILLLGLVVLLGIGAFLLLRAGAPGPASVARPEAAAAPPADAATLARGEKLYETQCASCHGLQLEGQPNWQERRADGKMPAPPHDASGHTWHHTDAMLFTVTKHGVQAIAGANYQSDMPAYEGTLSDEQIWAIIAYIKSTWPAEIQARQAEISRRSPSPQ